MIRRGSLPKPLVRASGVDDRVLCAYREAVRRYAGKSWVTGISVSRKETGGKLARGFDRVIAIHVRRKRRLPKSSAIRIPAEILGVPTDVVHGDYRRAANGAAALATALAPGASISCARGSAGTLGAIVRDDDGLRCLLTAGHVLRECGKCKRNFPIVHPGRADAAAGAEVARIADVHFGLDSGTAILANGVTAQNVALVSGVRITTPVVPSIDDVLEKSGRSSGLTRARVQGIGTFEGVFPAIQLRPLLGGIGSVISEPGDSGAVWYRADTGAAVGLLVAGGVSDDNTYSIAAVLTDVMVELDLTWT
jgi:hypothetical protein